MFPAKSPRAHIVECAFVVSPVGVGAVPTPMRAGGRDEIYAREAAGAYGLAKVLTKTLTMDLARFRAPSCFSLRVSLL